ncbi:MAG: hypothetical protein WBQ94_01280 [Terracidiphilus sp.]
MDEKRELLRHTLATVAYRAARALEDAPDGYASFDGAGRRPEQILAHMGDLFDWALSMAKGSPGWHNSTPLTWEAEKQRFFSSLLGFDEYLASEAPLHAPIDQLFQGPIADALTHVGQLAMLRRLASCPIAGENYYVAEVVAGRVCAEQAIPVKPFK